MICVFFSKTRLILLQAPNACPAHSRVWSEPATVLQQASQPRSYQDTLTPHPILSGSPALRAVPLMLMVLMGELSCSTCLLLGPGPVVTTAAPAGHASEQQFRGRANK